MRKIATICLLTLLLQSCGSLKSPEFVCVNSINIKEINLVGATASLNATIYNPNKHKLAINTADIDVYIKDIKVGRLSVDKKGTIAAKTNGKCDFIITVSTVEALRAGIFSAADVLKKNIELKLDGKVDGEYWFFKKEIKINSTIKPQTGKTTTL